MCQYQTLFHDDKTGYVIRCAECEKIQVGYGNLIMTFDVADLDQFRWWLKKIRDDNHPSQNENVRCIVIPGPCEGMRLLLSMRELREFNSMLDLADSELRSLEMIKMFH